MPHTVSCFKEIYLLSHNLPAQYFWFFWFLSTGHCTRLLVCMYLLRIIMLYPETYSGDLGSGSISASRRKRMRLSILEEDCKIAFSSHSVFSSLRFLLMEKKWFLKGKTWMFPKATFKAIKWSFLSNMIFFILTISSLALSKNQKRPLKNDDFLYVICDLFMFLLLYAFELANNYSYVARRRADLSYILWRGDYLKCENERKYKNSMKGFTTENMGPRPSSNPGYTLFLIMHTGIFFFF